MRACRFFRVCLITAVLSLFCSQAIATTTTYRVKPNDTLISIARDHGITVAALIHYNSAAVKANRIVSGQMLLIPKPTPAKTKSNFSQDFQTKLDRISVHASKWKHIVVHHSATEGGSAQGMDRYHREERHMENGLAYHFVIGNGHGMGDGEIVIGPRWLGQIQGGHLASETLNECSIGICLVGNFEEDRPTKKQLQALKSLLFYLLNRCDLKPDVIQTHQQINPIFTRCPGTKFPAKAFFKEIAKDYR